MTNDLLTVIRRAIYDPGEIVRRNMQPREPLPDWQARAVQAALTEAGYSIVRADDGRLPTATDIRLWLTAHGWTLRGTGEAGTLWSPPTGAESVGVLHDYGDASWAAEGAIARIADREGRAAADVKAEMLAITTDHEEARDVLDTQYEAQRRADEAERAAEDAGDG